MQTLRSTVHSVAQSLTLTRGIGRIGAIAAILALVAVAVAPATTHGVPNADSVKLSSSGLVTIGNVTYCKDTALVEWYAGGNVGHPLANYVVTFEVVAGPNLGYSTTAVSNSAGLATGLIPRPATGISSVRATLYGWNNVPLVVSNTVGCGSWKFPPATL